MAKRIGESTADDSHSWIFTDLLKLSTIDDVMKYRGIPVSRYFSSRYIIVRYLFLHTAHPWFRQHFRC